MTMVAYVVAALLIALGLYAFILPFAVLVHDLADRGLRSGAVPRFAFRQHRSLSKRLEAWAHQRVRSGRAAHLSIGDISGTEWPMFGCVFYLWATEALQEAWESNPSLSAVEPAAYARRAIEATAALISDPENAAWVQKHWGAEYLERQNLFYRMLLISGLDSYQRLLGDERYRPLLVDQVEKLSRELDASPFGLLDDYPGQCYPCDIVPAIAAIRRADRVLGSDHADFAARAVRGFEGPRLDANTGLPAYIANSRSGVGAGPARGVGMANMLIWAPELWPATAKQWYSRFEAHFWRRNGFVAGFREYARAAAGGDPLWSPGNVDAGPILAGFGTAASAFGIGAARANGRLDHAFPLAAEALVASWPLPNGTLFVPRLLSNLSDAPLVGEACLLFNLTRTPAPGLPLTTTRFLPLLVYLGAAVYLGVGLLLGGLALLILQLGR